MLGTGHKRTARVSQREYEWAMKLFPPMWVAIEYFLHKWMGYETNKTRFFRMKIVQNPALYIYNL